jgi:hypothetical protein
MRIPLASPASSSDVASGNVGRASTGGVRFRDFLRKLRKFLSVKSSRLSRLVSYEILRRNLITPEVYRQTFPVTTSKRREDGNKQHIDKSDENEFLRIGTTLAIQVAGGKILRRKE